MQPHAPTHPPCPHHGRVVAGGEDELLVGCDLEALACCWELKVLDELQSAQVVIVALQGALLILRQPLRQRLAARDVVYLRCDGGGCWLVGGCMV